MAGVIKVGHYRLGCLSVAKAYLLTPEGEFVGILPNYIFFRVEKILLHVGTMVCTTWSHGFSSRPSEGVLEVSSSP